MVFFFEKGFLRNIFQPFLFSLFSPAASFSAFKPDFLLVRQNLKDAGEDNRSAFLFQLRFALKWFSSVYPYCCHIQAVTEKNIAWLSLNFVLYTSWVALYSVVCVSGISNTRPNLHFFQYIQAYKLFADHAPPNTKHYQLILTKYQSVSSYTDPVPSSTTFNSLSGKAQFSQLNDFSFYDSFDESRTVYLV